MENQTDWVAESDPLDDARRYQRDGQQARYELVEKLRAVRRLFGPAVYDALILPVERTTDALIESGRSYEQVIDGYHDELERARAATAATERRFEELAGLLALAVEHTKARYAKARKDVPAWVTEAEALMEVPF